MRKSPADMYVMLQSRIGCGRGSCRSAEDRVRVVAMLRTYFKISPPVTSIDTVLGTKLTADTPTNTAANLKTGFAILDNALVIELDAASRGRN